jgi:MFS family permease
VNNHFSKYKKNLQYYKFCSYGFLKNLRFFEPFLILFFLEKNLTFFQIGILYTIREISINILEIPTGMIADSIGRRRTMVFSFVFYIISFTIFYFSARYMLFITGILFFSFGEAFRTGTHKAMIFEYLKIKGWENQKIHYYGHTRACSQMGSAISVLLAAAIVFYKDDYKFIFLYSVIPYVLDLILMITYPKELDGNVIKLNKKMIKQNFKKVFKEFVYSFKNIYLLRAITNLSLHSGFFKAVKDYLQPILKTFAISLPIFLFLENKQRSAVVIGAIYFIIYMLTSFASRKSGYIADKFKNLYIPLNITIICGLLMGLLSGIFFNLNILILSVIFYIGIYLTENLRKPIGISYVADMLNKDILATALSAESQAKTLFAAIIAPLIGLLADKYGIGNALMIISSILIMFFPLYFVKKNKKHKQPLLIKKQTFIN